MSEEDTTFIANARQDIPKLLAEIDRLRAEVDSLRDSLAWANQCAMRGKYAIG